MATESPSIHDGSQTTAAADLSAKQFYAVKLSAARAVNLASTGGENIYGILQNAPVSGAPADVVIFGICKAICGTAGVTAGAAVMTDTAGKLTDQTSTNVKVGVALETATVGQIFTMKVVPTPG